MDVFECIADGTLFVRFPPSKPPLSCEEINISMSEAANFVDQDEEKIKSAFPRGHPEAKRLCIERGYHLDYYQGPETEDGSPKKPAEYEEPVQVVYKE